MGIKSTFDEVQKLSKEKWGEVITGTQLYRQLESKMPVKDAMTLSALSFVFSKLAMSDLIIEARERDKIIEIIKKFVSLTERTVDQVISFTEKELRKKPQENSLLVASSVFFLLNQFEKSERAKKRLFRGLCDLITADFEIERNEEYLFKIIADAFELHRRDVDGHLMAMKISSENDRIELELESAEKITEDPRGGVPIITLDLD